MRTVGIGVIGCGFVGRGAHLPAFKVIEGANLVAVADPDSKRRTKAATKHQVNSAYADYRELIEDPEVQAIVVAIPTPLHAPATMMALEAGKHVLCEMPLATTLDEADQMIEAADRQGVCLMPGLTFRFTPNYVKSKEMIGQDAIGTPLAVNYREFIAASDLAGQWPAGSWMWNLEESGGPLYTLSVWSIDLLRWLFDTEIAEVNAAAKYTPLKKYGGTLGYDASATLELTNGVVASLQYSGSVNHAASESALEVVGDSTCVLHATDNDRVTLLGDEPAKTEWNVKQPGAAMWGHLQQDTHFVQCLQQERAPEISPRDGRKAMEIAEQLAAVKDQTS